MVARLTYSYLRAQSRNPDFLEGRGEDLKDLLGLGLTHRRQADEPIGMEGRAKPC